MPLVAHNDLPSFDRLRLEGQTVLSPERAHNQDIRELHVGLLNMMPDAALEATERQFFRLVGESNPIAQFYVHPFTLPELARSEKAQQHIDTFYDDFEVLREKGLDALIITGANVSHPELSSEPFWQPLTKIIDWAANNVTSTLCSCLATHAVMEARYGQRRKHMGEKRWGVFNHRVTHKNHPLVIDINTRFDVPHSRFNNISHEQFSAAGLTVLAESQEAGVHLAVSENQISIVFFQGHPEYDTISLLKEYKREVMRYANKLRNDYPPFPDYYFDQKTQAIFLEYKHRLIAAMKAGKALPEFPEKLIIPNIDNTWHDTAEAVIGNWIGTVYQITNNERNKPFMDHIDPNDPLGLKD